MIRLHLRLTVALSMAALAAGACSPPVVEPEVVRAGAPAAFPVRHYEQAAERGVPVFQVDPQRSRVAIEVRRAGSLASLGHDHVLVGQRVRGYIAPDEGRADLYMRPDELAVDDPSARAEAGFDTQPSSVDIEGTRYNMLHKVLDAQYPFVLIRVTGVDAEGQPQVAVELNGITRIVPVALNRATYGDEFIATGDFSFDQSDFGIVPLSLLGGAIRVRDRVDVRFSIDANRVAPDQQPSPRP